MKTPWFLLFVLTTVATGAVASPAPAAPAPVALELQLAPYADKGEVTALEVRLRIGDLAVPRGGIVAQLPMQVNNVDTFAEHIASIERPMRAASCSCLDVRPPRRKTAIRASCVSGPHRVRSAAR